MILNKQIWNKWFTIIELIISIAISALIISWLSYFTLKLNTSILSSQNKTLLYANIVEFMETLKNKRNIYLSWTVLIDTNEWEWFDVLLFTNKKQNKWILIWVVNVNSMKLDNNYFVYSNKVLWIKFVTNTQITNILNNTWTSYNLKFSEYDIYNNLQIQNFQIIKYNSWKILEANMQFEEAYNYWYSWFNIKNIPKKEDFIDIKIIL